MRGTALLLPARTEAFPATVNSRRACGKIVKFESRPLCSDKLEMSGFRVSKKFVPPNNSAGIEFRDHHVRLVIGS
jgi:hypothetical protein